MDEVQVAIIGLGEFGALHLDVLANLPGVRVVGLVSRSEERARQLAEKYNVPNTFQDTEELLEKVKLDAVHVVTEDTRHLEPTMSAMQAGVDVFLEKPISHDLEEARQMIDKATRLGRKLMVGHVLRFDIKCAAIKDRISKGELGKVVAVYGRRNIVRSIADAYRPQLFYTTAIHDIDLILWYFQGRKPIEVFMRSVDTFGEGDDVFWGLITMEDGSIGIVETAWVLPDATPWRGHILLQAMGSKSTALLEVPGNGLSLWTDSQVVVPDTSYWPSLHGTTVGALRDEIRYFIQCVVEDQAITMPYPEEAYQSLRVAEALVRSSRENRIITLG
jgi:UDP-N-acetylglucosamine 3-dehydrogenase